ncbi:MAG: lipoprotein signal peptidase [Bacteroidales bacterium]|nr:lipoprotein signal peptidase [Bacteroidales bacterium]
MNKKPAFIIIFIFLLVALDQMLKFYIKLNYYLGEEYVIFDWFRIHFTENEGMALGFTFGEGAWAKILLTLLRICAVSCLIWYLWYCFKKKYPSITLITFSFIVAGAIGNIIDSIFYGVIFSSSEGKVATFLPEEGGYSSFLLGNVVDMLYFPLFKVYIPEDVPLIGGVNFIFFQPIFNLADSYVTIGVIMIVLFYKKIFPKNL